MNRPPSFRPRPLPVSLRVVPRRDNALRRSSAGLLSVSLLTGLAAPSLWALQPAVVQGDNVNVRGRATLAGEVLIQLRQGDVIQLVDKIVAAGARNGEPSQWAQIQLPSSVPVYVHASYLDGDTVKATKLNIRGGPGENYSVLGHLQKGDKVHSVGRQGDWVRINPTPETYAFVVADYVAESTAPPPADTPVAVTIESPLAPSVAPAPMVAVSPVLPLLPSSAAPPAVASPVPPSVSPPVETVPLTEVPQAAPPAPIVPATVEPMLSPLSAVSSTPAVTVTPSASPVATVAPIILAKVEPIPPRSTTVPSAPTVTVTPPASAVARPDPAVAPASAALAAAQVKSPDASPNKKKVDKEKGKSAPPPAASTSPKDQSSQIKPPREEHHRNRFSLGYRFGMNVSAEFKGFGGSPAVPAGFYDNGYVLPSSRQAGPNPTPDGRTWNWGYNSPAQVQGGNLLMTRSTSPLSSSTHTLDDNSAAALGFELTYARELWSGGVSNDCNFGVEAALSYSSFDFKSTWQQSMPVVRTVDAYALGGVVPPFDPATGQTYQGTYHGPGPTIPGQPASSLATTVPNGATLIVHRELEANIYGLRLGPYFEGPIYKRLWGTIGAGVALGLVDGEFEYRDSYTAGLPASNRSGSASSFTMLVGWYVGAGVSYKFNHRWRAFYNIQYQSLSDYTLNADGLEARLKLGNAIYQSIGVSYSF